MDQLIVNQEYLSKTYLPKKLPHREKELAQLRNNLKNSVSTLMYGPCGSGKTTLVKHVFGALKGVYASYIDCSVYQTTYSILKEVVPRAPFILCRSNYELLKELMREAKQKKFVVCLDGFERLKEKELIRKFFLLGLTVVLITDEEENISLLTDDIRAKLSRVRFKPYTADQTFDILKDRAEKAFARWSCPDAVIRRIAEMVKGNITLAINTLKLAAIKAEGRGKNVIEESDIPEVEDCPFKLSRDEKALLKILREHGCLPAGKLYELYRRSVRYPRGERSFRNYMKSLNKKGFVRVLGEKRGRIYEVAENVEGNR